MHSIQEKNSKIWNILVYFLVCSFVKTMKNITNHLPGCVSVHKNVKAWLLDTSFRWQKFEPYCTDLGCNGFKNKLSGHWLKKFAQCAPLMPRSVLQSQKWQLIGMSLRSALCKHPRRLEWTKPTLSSMVSNLVRTMPSMRWGLGSEAEWSARAWLNFTSWSTASLPTSASPTNRTKSGWFTFKPTQTKSQITWTKMLTKILFNKQKPQHAMRWYVCRRPSTCWVNLIFFLFCNRMFYSTVPPACSTHNIWLLAQMYTSYKLYFPMY